MQRAGHLADVLGLSIALADIQITQGRLRDAMRTYEQALRLNPEHGGPVLRGTADMYVGMSAVHRERNDLPAARQLLARSEELGPAQRAAAEPATAGGSRWPGSGEAEGDLDAAVDLLDEAERVYVGDFSPERAAGPGDAGARLDPAGPAGRRPRAGRATRDSSADDELSYLREYEHVTLARALLAQHQVDGPSTRRRAAGPSPRCRRGRAPDGQRHRDPRAAGARARLRGDVPAALVPLERALALAEPEGYVRVFVDEGAPMTALLEAAGEHRRRPGVRRAAARPPSGAAADIRPQAQGLVDPLSERELDVLRLLGDRPGRSGDRPRARGVPEHGAHPHQEHLRQARGEQPPGRRTPRRGART